MPDAKERPILFSGPMVRAILDGRKTQTRRVVKSPWRDENNVRNEGPFEWVETPEGFSGCLDLTGDGYDHEGAQMVFCCPYGVPGGRLWVRETWREMPDYNENGEPITRIDYKADNPLSAGPAWPWRPSIHMSREDCRIILEITGVRVEKLQQISRDDAKAEGIPEYLHQLSNDLYTERELDVFRNKSTIENFRDIWDSINAKRSFGWEANPWVWVIGFRRAEE